jgi:CheY-like chemotaxis protein
MELAILYVEDDPENREIMRLLIEDVMGLSGLTMFENSHNFIERLDALALQPNVILLDIHVPPYDGFEMLKMLREHETFSDTPIAALTASVMNEEITKLKQSGFDGAISKPLDMDSFPNILERIMQGEKIWDIME